MNRREVLAGLGAAAAVGCAKDDRAEGRGKGDDDDDDVLGTADTGAEPVPAPDRAPEPEPWQAPGDEDAAVFAWGVAAGDPHPDGAILWVRTLAAEVELVVMAQDGDGWSEVLREPGLVPTDGVVQHTATGLAADTVHAYVFVDAGGGGGRSMVGRFRTALPPDGYRKLVFGASSCLGSSDDGYPSHAFVPAEQLDFFLFLGDSVYADGSDGTVAGFRTYWQRVEQKPTYRDVRASTGVVTTWDDHEVANNWTLGEAGPTQTRISQDRVDAGTAAFREAVPMRRGPGGSGIWRALRYGTVLDVFVLDCRGERGAGRIVSEEQLDWIATELAASSATFKLVAVSVHMTDHTAVMGFVEEIDRWQGYPDQRELLLELADTVPGVFFVTGDMHYGAIQEVSPAGAAGAGIVEIAAGPGGSELFPFATFLSIAVEEARAQYLDVVEAWNWARMVLDPGLGTLEVALVDDTGARIVSRTIALR